MRHLIGIAFLIVIILAISPAPVAAGWEWCEEDPIVHIDGVQVQLLIAVPVDYRTAVGRTQITFQTDTQSMTMDLGFWRESDEVGFNGYRGLASIGSTSQVVVNIVVPVDNIFITTVPVRVTAIVNGGTPQVFTGIHSGTRFTLELSH